MSFFSTILFSTLGIEPVQFEQSTPKEQKLFKFLHVLIWIGFIVCFVSASHYLWMIANLSVFWSMVLGLILGFVFISLVRIALLTFIPGIYNEKEKQVFSTNQNETEVVVSEGIKAKIGSLFKKGASFLKEINISKFLSYAFRFSFITLVGVVVSLGISCLIFKKRLDKSVDKYKEKIEANFAIYQKQKKNDNLASLTKEINTTQIQIQKEQSDLLKWKEIWDNAPNDSVRFQAEVQWNIAKREDSVRQDKLNELKEEFAHLEATETQYEQEQIEFYHQKISKEHFPVVRISEAFQMGSVKLVVLFMVIFFVFQAIMLVYLRTKPEFMYLELVNQFYRERVLEDFALLKHFVNGSEVREKYLGFHQKNKFGLKSNAYLQKEIKFYSEFIDPPFNFNPIQSPKKVIKGDMFDYLNTQI